MADKNADADALAGYIVSDKNRATVFSALVNGEGALATITKKHRLIGPAARRAAEDLKGRGLVSGDDGSLALTDLGREVEARIDRTNKKMNPN